MSAKLIDGKSIAARIKDEVRQEIADLGFVPGLGVILVGDDPASHLYVRLKEKACADAGIRMEKFLFPDDVPETMLLEAVAQLNARQDIDAILVQLPLPAPLDDTRIIDEIDPEKDVDGFHPKTIARYLAGDPIVAPGLVTGIILLIKTTGLTLTRKESVIIANSETFFLPLKKALEDEGTVAAFVTADDADLASRVLKADIVIVAAGRPKLITATMIKPGAAIIDVGTTRLDDKVVGDVDAGPVAEIAGHLTPVPGGVGPVTVAMLLKNTLELAKRRRR